MTYFDFFSLDKKLTNANQSPTNQRKKVYDYSSSLFDSAIGSDDFFRILEKELPPFFSRQTASKAIGGLISAKTMANLDSLGKGIENRVYVGSKVGYEKQAFLRWLRGRIYHITRSSSSN